VLSEESSEEHFIGERGGTLGEGLTMKRGISRGRESGSWGLETRRGKKVCRVSEGREKMKQGSTVRKNEW